MKVPEPKLLLIHMRPEKVQQIRLLSGDRNLSFRAVPVNREDETVPLGMLAGAENWMNRELMKNMPESVPLTEEMLIICGFEDRKMDLLLRKLRQSRLSVSLKAVLTEQNSVWTPEQLFGELKAERSYMMSRKH